MVLVRISDATIVYANPSFEQMLGYEPGTLNQQSLSELSWAPTPTPWQGELLNVRKDGSRFWSQVRTSSFEHLQYGRVWLSIQTDITELKAAQERALQAERLAAVGEMITGLAHESRNALQGSQGCLDRLAWRLEDRPDALHRGLRASRSTAHRTSDR